MIHQLPLRRISLSICLSFLTACGAKESSNSPLPTTSVEPPANASTVIISTHKETETKPGLAVSESRPSEGDGTRPASAQDVSDNLTTVPRFGSPQTFEIATWNIENYPKSGQTKENVSSLLKQLDLDLIAVEEISDEAALRELTATLPGFDCLLSPDKGNPDMPQNVGFIYRKANMEVVESQPLFVKENFAFPRAPLMVRFKMKDDSSDVVAIAVHLKAFGDDKSQTRREIANRQLEEFVSEYRKTNDKARIVVMGDFNERVDAEDSRDVFNPWLLKSESYQMLTEGPALRGDYSFISSNRRSLIDHIIASNNFHLEEPQIPKLQTVVPRYESNVSDHLPVMTRLR